MANKTAILSVRIIGDAKKAMSEMDKLGNHTSKFGSLAKSVGAVAVAGLAAAGAAITAATVAGVKAAADLEQSAGALDTVFGNAAASMHKNAKAASTALGLTENSYNELATLLGTQLKNAMGGASADMGKVGSKTNELIGLGADLASMFGGTTADAVGALSSALKGERDPIERYGVSLRQAQIDAKAAELGFTKVGGSLSNEANAAATLALIMEQTSAAHGNFAKETDTLSHQIEVAKAQLGNIVATIGQSFLPVLTAMGQGITTNVLPALQGIAEKYAPILANFFTQIGSLIAPLVGQLSQFVSSGLTPMGIGFQVVQTQSKPLMDTFHYLADVLNKTVIPAATHLAQTIAPPLMDMINRIAPPLMEIVNVVIRLVGSLVDSLFPPLTQIVEAILPPLIDIIGALIPFLAEIVQAVAPIIDVIGKIIGLIQKQLAPVIKYVATVISINIQTITGVFDGFFKLVSGLITGDWQTAWNGAKQIFTTIWNSIRNTLNAALEAIKGCLSAALENAKTIWSGWNALKTVFANVWEAIKTGLAAALNAINTAVTGGINTTVNTVRQLPGKAVAALGNIGQALFNAGKNLVQGFINGIKSMFGAIGSAARDIGNKAMSGVKNVLGIRSPSKVFTDIGIMTGRGMVDGVEKMRVQVQDALQDMVNPRNLKALATTIKPPAINTTLAITGAPYTTPKSQPNSTVNITINGAVDPDSTARQIKALLNRYNIKTTALQLGV